MKVSERTPVMNEEPVTFLNCPKTIKDRNKLVASGKQSGVGINKTLSC